LVSLVQFAKDATRLLTFYQNRRLRPAIFSAVRQARERPARFGRIVRFETSYDRFRPQLKPNRLTEAARPGAGMLFDIAHMYRSWLFFWPAEAVTARLRSGT